MPEPRRLIATIIVSLMAAGACSPTASPPASTSPAPSTGSASIAPVPSDLPSPSPKTPPASVAPTSAPPATSQILVRGSARELSENPVLMAPTRDGHLYVEVPSRAPGSTVLTRFDSGGRSAPGWPVTLHGATYCAAPMPVADGSVRMLCTLQNTTGGQDSGRAFAFDDSGRALPGWPVEIDDPVVTGRLIGDSLRVLANVAIDTEDEESPAEWFLLSIDAAGVTTNGVVMPKSECCPMVAIGPDGAAYSVTPGFRSEAKSQITAFDMDGVLPRFPTAVVGVASGVSFDADGNIWVLSAHPADRTSRVLMVFDTGSVPLPFAAADPATDQTGGCESTAVLSPLMPSDRNGLIVEYSDVDDTVFAVNRNLDTAKGWPFTLPDPLVHPRPGAEFEHEAGYCPGPLAPIVGPDGTVYLALQAHRSSVGGSLVAVGPDGRVRAGWPVGLKRAGAEFWSIAVGPDKTVYAIAYEPAAGGTSTATVLAIAPDSTIVYRTTIIAPA